MNMTKKKKTPYDHIRKPIPKPGFTIENKRRKKRDKLDQKEMRQKARDHSDFGPLWFY